jgi:ubiquinone/menaquinone biosynthesis C-methylase UbiE
MPSDDASPPVDELLAAAYALDGPDDSRSLYARWADTYDSTFIVASKYVYHEHVAKVFADHARDSIGPAERVVDVGCGTGIAGVALRRHGFVEIDGIDISPEMLDQAAAKRDAGDAVYRKLIEADLTQPLAIAADTYAGAVSTGTFTHGHVGPAALAEVVRILRPGALAAIGINAAHFSTFDFGTALDQLVEAGRISDLQLVDVPIYADAPQDDPDRTGHVAVFRVR